MTLFPQEMLQDLICTYGYWVIALVIGLESMGIPLPGETMLVLASIYAAREPSLNIWLVILAAAAGSILGDNAGYWIGHRYAYAAPIGGVASGLANADPRNGVQQAAYRCWYRYGVRHCRYVPGYYYEDPYSDYGPDYGYGPGVGLFFGGGGGGHFHGGHFGGHHHR